MNRVYPVNMDLYISMRGSMIPDVLFVLQALKDILERKDHRVYKAGQEFQDVMVFNIKIKFLFSGIGRGGALTGEPGPPGR